MATGVVLVHGAGHGSWCWERVVPLLDGPVLTVDLPGRAGRPTPPREQVAAAYGRSLVADVEAAGLDACVLVGHSLGGLTLPAAAAALGRRVRHLVFVAALVPRKGDDQASALPRGLRCVSRVASRHVPSRSDVGPWTRRLLRWMYCNDLDAATTDWLLERVVQEPPGTAAARALVGIEEVDVPATYVHTRQDRCLAPRRQREMAARLGPAHRDVVLDSGHEAMLARPQLLATAIADVVARHEEA